MKKRLSPLLIAGLVIYTLCIVIERLIVRIPNAVFFTLYLVATVLIIIGGYRAKKSE